MSDTVRIEQDDVRGPLDLPERLDQCWRFAEGEQPRNVGEGDAPRGDPGFDNVEVGKAEHDDGGSRDRCAVGATVRAIGPGDEPNLLERRTALKQKPLAHAVLDCHGLARQDLPRMKFAQAHAVST